MMTTVKRLLSIPLILSWLCLIPPAVAEESLPVPPFEALYTVYAKGIPVGEAVMALSDGGNGRYRMRSDVYPTGAVALFFSEKIKERVQGSFRDGKIQPLHYEQRRTGSKDRTVRLDFDWQAGVVRGKKDDEAVSLPLSPRVVDPLSLHLLAMSDLKNGDQINEYTLISDDRLKTYQVQRHGEETLKTSLGKLKTLRTSQQRAGSDNTTTIWFAPELGYLPVQIVTAENGKEEMRMTIKKVREITAQ